MSGTGLVKRIVTLAGLASFILSNVGGLCAAKPFIREKSSVSSDTQKVKPYSRHPSREALKWADKELKRMSLDEKIGQLICAAVNATFLNQDSEAFKALRHQVVDNHVGGIILFRGPVYESVMLVNRMQLLAKHPLLIS